MTISRSFSGGGYVAFSRRDQVAEFLQRLGKTSFAKALACLRFHHHFHLFDLRFHHPKDASARQHELNQLEIRQAGQISLIPQFLVGVQLGGQMPDFLGVWLRRMHPGFNLFKKRQCGLGGPKYGNFSRLVDFLSRDGCSFQFQVVLPDNYFYADENGSNRAEGLSPRSGNLCAKHTENCVQSKENVEYPKGSGSPDKPEYRPVDWGELAFYAQGFLLFKGELLPASYDFRKLRGLA